MLTHVASWEQAIQGLLAALDGHRAGRRVVGVAVLELVINDGGVPSVVLQHGVSSGFVAAPGAVLREFAAALVRTATEQTERVQ